MKKRECFSPDSGSVQSREKDATKGLVSGGRKSKWVSRHGTTEICKQRRIQKLRPNSSAFEGQAEAGSRSVGESEIPKDTAPGGERHSVSASFLRSTPLQQLRALARAAEVGCSTRASTSFPHVKNKSSSGLGGRSTTARQGETNTQLRKRPADHEKAGTSEDRPARRRLGLTSETAKKVSNKKLPSEVSSRLPHFATGQPLRCTYVLPARCADELSLLSPRVGHIREGADVCLSDTCSSAPRSSSTSSRKTTPRDSHGGGESCTGNDDSSGRVLLAASVRSCLSKEEAGHRCAAANKHFAERPASPQKTYTCERHMGALGAQQQLTEQPPQGLGVASHLGQTREKKLLCTQQEREAALQRHLKSLRSLRVRLAAGGNGDGRARALRIGREVRDPRFSEACGPLDLRMVGKAYAFLDSMRKQEAEQLQRLLKSRGLAAQGAACATARTGEGRGHPGAGLCQVQAEKVAAQKALQRLRSQEEARQRKGVELVVKGQLARKEKSRIAQTGKRPFFVSRREVNRLVQAEWQKRRHGGNACGQRRAAKQEEKKARNKLAKEKRLSLVPVRRLVEKAAV